MKHSLLSKLLFKTWKIVLTEIFLKKISGFNFSLCGILDFLSSKDSHLCQKTIVSLLCYERSNHVTQNIQNDCGRICNQVSLIQRSLICFQKTFCLGFPLVLCYGNLLHEWRTIPLTIRLCLCYLRNWIWHDHSFSTGVHLLQYDYRLVSSVHVRVLQKRCAMENMWKWLEHETLRVSTVDVCPIS